MVAQYEILHWWNWVLFVYFTYWSSSRKYTRLKTLHVRGWGINTTKTQEPSTPVRFWSILWCCTFLIRWGKVVIFGCFENQKQSATTHGAFSILEATHSSSGHAYSSHLQVIHKAAILEWDPEPREALQRVHHSVPWAMWSRWFNGAWNVSDRWRYRLEPSAEPCRGIMAHTWDFPGHYWRNVWKRNSPSR